MSIIDVFLSTVLRLRLVFSSSAHIKIRLLLESLFFSLLRHTTLRLQKKKHVLLGSTGHDACDPLRGSGEKQKQTGGRCQRGIRYVLRSGGEEESRKSNRQSPTDANFVGRFERE